MTDDPWANGFLILMTLGVLWLIACVIWREFK